MPTPAAPAGDTPKWGQWLPLLTGTAWQHGPSPLDRVRRQRPRAITVLLILLLAGCADRQRRQAEQDRLKAQQLQHTRCLQTRRALLPLLAAWDRDDARLMRLRAEVYVPTAPPTPLDPEEQRRLTINDQDVEQEAYQQVYAAWQELNDQRRRAWLAEWNQRLEGAVRDRAVRAQALRRVAPSLVTATDPAQLRAAERARLLQCGAPTR